MLQAIRPAGQAIIQNRTVQQFVLAVGCGVTTLYTIRALDNLGARRRRWASNRQALKAQRQAAKLAKAEEAKAVEASTATPEPVTEAVVSDAVQTVMEGASFNELRAAAKSHGLDVGPHPTKEALARAIVEFQTASA